MGLLSIRKVLNSSYQMTTIINPPFRAKVILRNRGNGKTVKGIKSIYDIIIAVNTNNNPYIISINKSNNIHKRIYGNCSKKEMDDLMEIFYDNITLFEHLIDKENSEIKLNLN